MGCGRAGEGDEEGKGKGRGEQRGEGEKGAQRRKKSEKKDAVVVLSVGCRLPVGSWTKVKRYYKGEKERVKGALQWPRVHTRHRGYIMRLFLALEHPLNMCTCVYGINCTPGKGGRGNLLLCAYVGLSRPHQDPRPLNIAPLVLAELIRRVALCLIARVVMAYKKLLLRYIVY